MTKSLWAGLVGFCVAYIAIPLLLSWVLPSNGWLASIWASYLFVYSAAALCAVLVGTTIGRLTFLGVAGCALLISLAIIAFVLGTTVVFDLRGSNEVVPLSLLGSAVAGVWLWWLGGVISAVIWPVVWLFVLRRVTPRLAPSLGS